MEFSDAIAKLKARMVDALKLDVGKDNPAEFTLAALVQVMNEAERHKQTCLNQVQNLREQARAAEYQASAYSQIHAIVWSVYDGLVKVEERSVQERLDRAAEKAAEESTEAEPEKRPRKKK